MEQYLDLARRVIKDGRERGNRTNTRTIDRFGDQIRFDLSKGFPTVTTKKLHLRSIIYELLWFLRGDSNIAYLKENNVSIWDEWADKDGELGPGVYGKMWREWPNPDGSTTDQILNIQNLLRNNPDSRRNMLVTYHPSFAEVTALPPCHSMCQFYVDALGRVCSHLYQRSADLFLGVPFNIASYSLLTHMFAQTCERPVGEFIHSFGSVHIYKNHLDQINLQLARNPLPLPTLKLNPAIKDILDFKFEDIEIVGYQSHPAIKGEVAV